MSANETKSVDKELIEALKENKNLTAELSEANQTIDKLSIDLFEANNSNFKDLINSVSNCDLSDKAKVYKLRDNLCVQYEVNSNVATRMINVAQSHIESIRILKEMIK